MKHYLEIAKELNAYFAKDAAERDAAGGIPKKQRDLIRESGLLKLLIPEVYGGSGAPWSAVLEVVREFAKTDSSLAHLYGYHFLQVVNPHFSGNDRQKAYFYEKTAKEHLFWGNAYNFLDKSVIGTAESDRWLLNGTKSFCTGSEDADMLLVGFTDSAENNSYVAIVEASRQGITVNEDWDGLGQRQTGSGSVTFKNLVVKEEEMLREGSNKGAFGTMSAILSQGVLLNVFIGLAHGALAEAKDYVKTKSKPWITSGVEQAADDPFILRRFGEFAIDLQAAEALADQANARIDQAWEKETLLTEAERGETAVVTASANAFASKTALDITGNIFEVMGARSAVRKKAIDRFWRNVRTHTLHNPLEYKRKNVGNYYLKGEIPPVTDYS